MPLSEHVYCVALTFKLTKPVEQQICIKFCVKLEHSSTETIQMIQKTSYGQLEFGSFITTHSLMHHISCRVFWWNIKSPRWFSPPTAHIWHPVTFAFPNTKITFEREEISVCQWDSGKYNRAADGDWENCVRSQGPYLEEDWGVTVLYTMLLVSSSINVSIFHITWLDTYWTDLI